MRFGGAIEADLAERYGEDLSRLWRARRWRRLLVLIDGLPAWSRFGAAFADDDEYAEAALSRDGERKPSPPSLAYWDPILDVLNDIRDRIADNLAAATGGKVRIPPRERPMTALDRAREGQARQRQLTLVKRLLPNS